MTKKSTVFGFPALYGAGFQKGEAKALAFLSSNGKIGIVSSKTKNSKILKTLEVPFLRGVSYFFFGLFAFFSFLNRSLSFLDGERLSLRIDNKISKKLNISKKDLLLTILGVASFIIGFFLFSVVPRIVGKALPITMTNFSRNLSVALIKIALFYLFLLSLKIIPSMRQFYRENGAVNFAMSHKLHVQPTAYLSTNFLAFVCFCFLVDFFVVSLIGIEIFWAFEILINLGILLLVFSFMFEFLNLLKYPKDPLSKAFVVSFSFLVTEKPSSSEIEIAESALFETLELFENKERNVMDKTKNTPMSAIRTEVRHKLASAGIDDESEADWLIALSLGISRGDVHLRTELCENDVALIRSVLSRRVLHEPLSNIFQSADFYGRKFYVDKNVLTPRMETELVAEEAIKEIGKIGHKANVLDLCTGSGCVAITISKETGAIVDATDISKEALEVAKKNSIFHSARVSFLLSDMFSRLKKKNKFDIIVSNPPYLETNELSLVSDEVRNYDPLLSLDGGDDGLMFYREIADKAPSFLHKNGKLILEIGYMQGKSVKAILSENFEDIQIVKDYFGNDRVVIATKKEKK